MAGILSMLPDFALNCYRESLSVDICKNTQPKRKKNPIAAVRWVIGGMLNKINLMILMNIRMAHTANDTRDIISVASLDIGCL